MLSPAHQTQAQGGGERTYLWEYSDELRKLRVTFTWLASITEAGDAQDTCDAEVIRGQSSST
jgi:hypothetical protein